MFNKNKKYKKLRDSPSPPPPQQQNPPEIPKHDAGLQKTPELPPKPKQKEKNLIDFSA